MLLGDEDKIIFKILGSGACVPKMERSSPSYFLKYNESKFLLDCGAGALRQLVKAKECYKDLTGVVLSHFHPDHTSDFIPLIQALNYTPGFRREKELLVFGPKGLKEFINSLCKVYKLYPIGYKMKFVELDGSYEFDNGLVFSAMKGNHSENSIVFKAFYKNSDGIDKSLVYSGDTGYDLNIAKFARNTNLLILECSFPEKTSIHLNPEEAGQIAELAHPNKLLLTHFYPPCDNPEIKIQHRVKEYFIGNVLLAQDLMELIV